MYSGCGGERVPFLSSLVERVSIHDCLLQRLSVVKDHFHSLCSSIICGSALRACQCSWVGSSLHVQCRVSRRSVMLSIGWTQLLILRWLAFVSLQWVVATVFPTSAAHMIFTFVVNEGLHQSSFPPTTSLGGQTGTPRHLSCRNVWSW